MIALFYSFYLLLILASLLAIPALAVGAFVVGLRTAHRKWYLCASLAITLAMVFMWRQFEQRHALSVVPDGLHVTSMSYAAEESWGFGPGGNETGIRVYPLSAQVARAVGEDGLAYFASMPPNRGRDSRAWEGVYSSWHATPIGSSASEGADAQGSPISLEAYHDQYGFSIQVDPVVSAQVNRIIQSPGSFYARGRIGILVVSPKDRLVVYMYNG